MTYTGHKYFTYADEDDIIGMPSERIKLKTDVDWTFNTQINKLQIQFSPSEHQQKTHITEHYEHRARHKSSRDLF